MPFTSTVVCRMSAMGGEVCRPDGGEASTARERVDPRAVVAGAAVDHLLTLLVGVALARWPPAFAALVSLPEPGALAAFGAAGLGCTAAGGLVAGAASRASPVADGATVGAFALAVGLLGGFGAEPGVPAWYATAGMLLVVPAGALGGLVARGLRRSRSGARPY